MNLSTQDKERILWFIGVVVTIVVLLAIAHPIDKQRKRLPASVPAKPQGKIMDSGIDHFHRMSKGGGKLEISVSELSKASSGNKSVLTLEADVKALADLNDLQYVWLLPEGVIVQTGVAQDRLGKLSMGETTKLQISVEVPQNENKQIHLHVFRMIGGEASGQIAQYNTRDQKKIDNKIIMKAEMLKKKLHSDNGFKIVQ